MKTANKLTKFGIWFQGPLDPETFKLIYIEPEDFDLVVIGTGESQAVAANRALSHLEGKGIAAIYSDIYRQTNRVLGKTSALIEAPEQNRNIYCIIAISAEWTE